ncbi:MAG: hypothetical protein ACE5J9_03465 [Methanosarcinales archaeon]
MATWSTTGLSSGSNYLIKASATGGLLLVNDTSDTTFSLVQCGLKLYCKGNN